MHKDELLPFYEIIQRGDVSMKHILCLMPNLLLGLVRVIESLKVRHDITKFDLSFHLSIHHLH